jgi:hypothetical protein
MPSCNFAKMVYNKWLQQSGNRDTDLYFSIINNFVRALMQVVRYYQYLKGEYAGTTLGKEELLLGAIQRSIQQSKDPKVLNAALANLPRPDIFYTHEPHLVGEEIFGFQKHEANVPLGFEAG